MDGWCWDDDNLLDAPCEISSWDDSSHMTREPNAESDDQGDIEEGFVYFFVANQELVQGYLEHNATPEAMREKAREIWKALPFAERKTWASVPDMSLQSAKRDTKQSTIMRRPPSAFIFFANLVRPAMRAKYPHSSPQEHQKKIAEIWKTLSDKEQQPFRRKILTLQKQYKKYRELTRQVVREQRKHTKESMPTPSAGRMTPQQDLYVASTPELAQMLPNVQVLNRNLVGDQAIGPPNVPSSAVEVEMWWPACPTLPFSRNVRTEPPIILSPNGMPYGSKLSLKQKLEESNEGVTTECYEEEDYHCVKSPTSRSHHG